MNIIKVTLEVITPMFSYGNNQNQPEFRLTELKSLMRTTFREVYKFKDLDDMKTKEGELFGSLENKSPIVFRVVNKVKNSDVIYQYLCLHREDRPKVRCINYYTKVEVELLVKDRENINTYIDILILTSILGGIGKRSRKGLGSFKINEIIYDDKKDFSNLLNCSLEETLMRIKEHNSFKYQIRDFSYNKGEFIFSEGESDMKYPYLKKIHIYKLGDEEFTEFLKKVSKITHQRLNNKEFWKNRLSVTSYSKDILGNFIPKYKMKNEAKSIPRFASPIYVTCWEKSKNERCIIVKELNYEYILEILYKKYKINMEKMNASSIIDYFDYMKNNENYVNEYVNKLKEILVIEEGRH